MNNQAEEMDGYVLESEAVLDYDEVLNGEFASENTVVVRTRQGVKSVIRTL